MKAYGNDKNNTSKRVLGHQTDPHLASERSTSGLRLQVYLSRNGVCSRRKALEIIQAGQVQVNGQVVTEASTPIGQQDRVVANGRPVITARYEYIVMNKPEGYVTTHHDPFASKTVYELLPPQYRHLATAGRLDKDTEGLLLFTNDGDVIYQLTHPKFELFKTYFVIISGCISLDAQKKLERGLLIDGKNTSPAKLSQVKTYPDRTQMQMTIHEGRKRQIRRMFEMVGYEVRYLKRLSQGPLQVGDLKTGLWRYLTGKEIQSLSSLKGY